MNSLRTFEYGLLVTRKSASGRHRKGARGRHARSSLTVAGLKRTVAMRCRGYAR